MITTTLRLRRVKIALAGLFLCISRGDFCNSLRAADRPPAVEAAIQKGIAHLRKAEIDEGEHGIVAYSFLAAGVPATDPDVQRLLEKIVAKCAGPVYVPKKEHIYEAGTDAMALAAANPDKYRPQAQLIADYLIQTQKPLGYWDYLNYPTGDDKGDTSISQYAMLGLWAAARTGASVPLKAWDLSASWHLKTQHQDGAFAYHPQGAGPQPSHSMTVAGIGSLAITRMYLTGQTASVNESAGESKKNVVKDDKRFGVLERAPSGEPEPAAQPAEAAAPAIPRPAEDKSYKATVGRGSLDAGIGRGMGWLSTHYTINRQSGWRHYYLYGMERAAALTNVEKIAGKDWYKEGSDFLIKDQKPNGSWFDDSGGGGGAPTTCFGVLFLSRATAKIVPQAPGRAPAKAKNTFGGGLLTGGRGLPKDLSNVDTSGGTIKPKTENTPLDAMLAELSNPKSAKVEKFQDSIVQAIQVGNRAELIGQKDLLLKLVKDKRVEVRRTAFWALGRCSDIRVAPVLIQGLTDDDFDVSVEARNSLCLLSRKPRGFGLMDDVLDQLPETASEAERAAAVERWRRQDTQRWKDWYASVRPYDERDSLPD